MITVEEWCGGDYPQSTRLPDFDTSVITHHQADVHLVALHQQQMVGRLSLWWNQVPKLNSERLGVVGHFDAVDASVASDLLLQARQRLKARGCTVMVGPMDGNTWRRYRWVNDAGSEPLFFLEPGNPPAYVDYFLQAGFRPMARYISSLVADLNTQDPRIPAACERLQKQGISWRALDMSRFEDELKAIYQLSIQSFSGNFLYTPITEAGFLQQYQSVQAVVEPQLVLLAEQQGELLGYLFAIPDLNQARRGEVVDTCVLKTVAVLPGRRAAGLGAVLVAECHRIARDMGYRRVIHALMHASNKSKNLSSHYGQSIREYTLYQYDLDDRP
ncbi:N-acetyltransferase family protein [Gynuella sp.]|uniref:GNAT family N-acetyltransferase n=1 Tax=Gynuella sp. TaxID=2969146 RepID=UPI003D150468